jgi:putative SOS response-associated peptidase YedK
MCGRVAITYDADWLRRRYGTVNPLVNFPPNTNGAPTESLPVVRLRDQGGSSGSALERHLDLLRWGLVPPWAKDIKIGARFINARAETVATQPAFRDAYQRRRCLVPVSAFYEWKREAKTKQPFAIGPATDGERALTLAGLWDRWKSPEGQWIVTCSIVTTEPNAAMAALHDRMPVVLGEADWPLWLGERVVPRGEGPGDISALLRPCPDDWLKIWPVSAAVNNVRNKGPELLDPLRPA